MGLVLSENGVYRVERQEFLPHRRDSSPTAYQSFPPERNGVYRVQRQEFTNANSVPFSGSYGNEFGESSYLGNKFFNPFGGKLYVRYGNSSYGTSGPQVPKLFVPSNAGNVNFPPPSQTFQHTPPNYNRVVPMSHFGSNDVSSQVYYTNPPRAIPPQYIPSSKSVPAQSANGEDGNILPAIPEFTYDNTVLPPISDFSPKSTEMPLPEDVEMLEVSDEQKDLLWPCSEYSSNFNPKTPCVSSESESASSALPIRKRRSAPIRRSRRARYYEPRINYNPLFIYSPSYINEPFHERPRLPFYPEFDYQDYSSFNPYDMFLRRHVYPRGFYYPKNHFLPTGRLPDHHPIIVQIHTEEHKRCETHDAQPVTEPATWTTTEEQAPAFVPTDTPVLLDGLTETSEPQETTTMEDVTSRCEHILPTATEIDMTTVVADTDEPTTTAESSAQETDAPYDVQTSPEISFIVKELLLKRAMLTSTTETNTVTEGETSPVEEEEEKVASSTLEGVEANSNSEGTTPQDSSIETTITPLQTNIDPYVEKSLEPTSDEITTSSANEEITTLNQDTETDVLSETSSSTEIAFITETSSSTETATITETNPSTTDTISEISTASEIEENKSPKYSITAASNNVNYDSDYAINSGEEYNVHELLKNIITLATDVLDESVTSESATVNYKPVISIHDRMWSDDPKFEDENPSGLHSLPY